MKYRIFIYSCLLLLPVFGGKFLLSGAHAQQADIVAFINQDVITAHDLQQQIEIFKMLSVIPDNEDALTDDLTQQILEALIVIRLRLELIASARITPNPQALAQEYAGVENRLKIEAGSLFDYIADKNISKDALESFFISNIMWESYVRRFSYRFIPTDSEISTRYQKTLNQLSQNRYLFNEIILPVSSILDDKKKRQQTEDLIGQLQAGADFKNIARNISSAASANQGGSRGWVAEGDLKPTEYDVLSQIAVNGLTSEPVRLEEGYAIYWLEDKKEPDSRYQQNLDYNLQIFSGDGKGQTRASNYAQDAEQGFSCDDEQLVNGATEIKLGKSSKSHLLDTELQNQLALLVVSEKSDAFFYQGQWAVVGLCNREEIGTSPIKRKQISEQIIYERLNQFAAQHLQEKRREAYIEFRS